MPQKRSHRVDRVNALLQKLVGEEILYHVGKGPGLVTVSKVEASRDLRWAKVWISIVGGDDKAIFRALEKSLYDIQGEINRKLKMKIVPRLQFFLDTSPRYAQHIDELVH